jgi:predicted RNase H-like HicB family nuclease
MGTRKYAVVIEKARNNFSAYVPDLPGCVSTGRTIAETRRNIADAIAFHLRGMAKDGDPMPDEPTSAAATVAVQFDRSLWKPQTAAGSRRKASALALPVAARIVAKPRQRRKA